MAYSSIASSIDAFTAVGYTSMFNTGVNLDGCWLEKQEKMGYAGRIVGKWPGNGSSWCRGVDGRMVLVEIGKIV